MDINDLDLSLILTLDILLAERNVTRAARRLNISQPALSARLNRLRDIFGDQLLLPAQRGMVVTQRALELQEPLHKALENLRQIVAESAPFDAPTTAATVAIAGSDYVQYSVLVPLIRVLREKAPGIRVAWRSLDVPTVGLQMEQGEIDLAIVTPESAPESFRMINLYHERYVVIVRKNHPRVHGEINLDLFCDLDHIIVSPRGGGFRGATDLILEVAKRSRRTVLSTPSFLVVLKTVEQTDMIAVVPAGIARDYTDTLQVLEPPLEIPGFDLAMIWHDRTTNHPTQRWLREQLVNVTRQARRQNPS